MTDDTNSTAPSESLRASVSGWAHPAVFALCAISAVVLVAGRFVVTTPMWLDEALSVNIAKLPIGEIGDALRHDGHPPLYYLLLHWWIGAFGDGDLSVRALSALISVATLPLAWAAGRRIGGARLGLTTLFVVALSPYAFRFGSETRMYSLLMLLSFAGYLLASSAIERPNARNLIGVAVVVGAGLWSHYWTLWLAATAGLLVLWIAWRGQRAGDTARRNAALATAGAFVVGGLSFLPWLPTMLYQNAHTGTPWAPRFRPAELVFTSLTNFAGGPYSEAQLGILLLTVLIVIGLFGRARSNTSIELNFPRLRSDAVIPAVLAAGTAAIASAVALVNGMAFAPRYAAGFFPFVAIIIALGIERFRGGALRNTVIVILVVFSFIGTFFVLRLERSQVGEAARRIDAAADSALVVACPDQLGPSLGRRLDRDRHELLAYPVLDEPDRVDWVDYAERNARLDPAAIAGEIVDRAGDRPIFVVFGDQFLTLEGQCQRLVGAIAGQRRQEILLKPEPERYWEPVTVVQLTRAG